MPKQSQLFFERTLATKQELKELMLMIKDALANSSAYQNVLDQIKNLNTEKKVIVDNIKADFGSEASKIDTLKLDIENDKMLMSDAALSQLMAGETVEVEDKHGNKYTPVFSVKFKKIK